MMDDFGNRLTTQTCDSPVPCRHCLRLTRPDEEVILFAYRPFETAGPYSEVGPVFIHGRECPAYAESLEFPADFMTRKLVLRAYNALGQIEDAEVAEPGSHGATLERLFAQEAVKFVHARNVAYGCFLYQLDRVTP